MNSVCLKIITVSFECCFLSIGGSLIPEAWRRFIRHNVSILLDRLFQNRRVTRHFAMTRPSGSFAVLIGNPANKSGITYRFWNI